MLSSRSASAHSLNYYVDNTNAGVGGWGGRHRVSVPTALLLLKEDHIPLHPWKSRTGFWSVTPDLDVASTLCLIRRKLAPLFWTEMLLFHQAWQRVHGKYLSWVITTGLKSYFSRGAAWWLQMFGIWNLWGKNYRFVYCQSLQSAKGTCTFDRHKFDLKSFKRPFILKGALLGLTLINQCG